MPHFKPSSKEDYKTYYMIENKLHEELIAHIANLYQREIKWFNYTF